MEVAVTSDSLPAPVVRNIIPFPRCDSIHHLASQQKVEMPPQRLRKQNNRVAASVQTPPPSCLQMSLTAVLPPERSIATGCQQSGQLQLEPQRSSPTNRSERPTEAAGTNSTWRRILRSVQCSPRRLPRYRVVPKNRCGQRQPKGTTSPTRSVPSNMPTSNFDRSS